MRVLLEEMMLDFPGMVDAEPVGELDLVERLVVDAVLIALAPGPRQLMLVEDAELHRAVSLGLHRIAIGDRIEGREMRAAARQRHKLRLDHLALLRLRVLER